MVYGLASIATFVLLKERALPQPGAAQGQGLAASLARLRQVALSGGNVFEELLETVKVASLGEISEALFEVGGRYRRST